METLETEQQQKSLIPEKNPIQEKMSHKKWKNEMRKWKRKKKRILEARERDISQTDLETIDSTDSEGERRKVRDEADSRRNQQLWIEREKQAQIEFKAKKDREERERIRKEETEQRIREEWEAREKKEKEETEEREKKENERKQKQEKLLKEATKNAHSGAPGAWHNPLAPVNYAKDKEVEHCPFFKKTAACRFGDQCSRYHDYPETSTIILIPGMFTNFELEQSIVDQVDTDISLEYEDSELHQAFRDFYHDIVPEFKAIGTLLTVKVACNCEPHLRGNVYVQYKRESVAQEAFQKFNARWYGGKQLSCIFVNIESWKAAICGLAFSNRCPKGKSCNFLHVFRNPRGEFMRTESDWRPSERQSHNRFSSRARSRSPSHHSTRSSRYRSRSRSPSHHSTRSSRYRSRSRSPSHHSTRSSRYRSKSRSPGHHSTRSSRYRSRSRSRSPAKDKNDRKRSRSMSPSRLNGRKGYSRSKSRSRSPSRWIRKRSKSKSPTKQRQSMRRSRSKSRSKIRKEKKNSKSRSRSRSRSEYDKKNTRSRSKSTTIKEKSKEELSGLLSKSNSKMLVKHKKQYSMKSNNIHPGSQSPQKENVDQSPPIKKSNLSELSDKNKNSLSRSNTNSSSESSDSSDGEYEFVEVTKETIISQK